MIMFLNETKNEKTYIYNYYIIILYIFYWFLLLYKVKNLRIVGNR